MELPFTGFELTFIIVAFIIFTLFSLASVCFQPQAARPGTHLASDITTETNVSLCNADYLCSISEKDVYEVKKLQPCNRKQRVIIKEAGQNT